MTRASRALIGFATTAGEALGADFGRGVERGKASWYGAAHHGRRTANGETFDRKALTAAHRSLPFGTRLKVTNERTGPTTADRSAAGASSTFRRARRWSSACRGSARWC